MQETKPKNIMNRLRLFATAALAFCLCSQAFGQIRSIEWSADSFDPSMQVEMLGAPGMIYTSMGTALEFDGKGDAIFVGSVPVKGMEEFTIQMIFKPYGNAPFEQRFMHMGEYNGARIMFESRVKPDNTWYFDAFVHMGTKEESKALVNESLTHPTDRWYNLALTVSKDGIASYVDGVQQSSYPLKYDRLAIGEGVTSVGVRQNMVCWFKGAILKILVTPKVLAPDQFLKDQETLNK